MNAQNDLRLSNALKEATARHQRGDLAEAVRLYKIVLRKVPKSFEALYFLGIAEAQRGYFDRAERQIRQALAVRPQSAEAHAALGNVQRELGRCEDALASYDVSLGMNAADPIAHNGRGVVLLALGRAQEALSSIDLAIAKAPDFVGAWHNRGIVLRGLKETEAAIASFDRGLAVDPNAVALHVERGTALAEMGRLTEALAAFGKALALDPRSVDAHYNRGVALVTLGRIEDALASFEQALALVPGFTAALTNRASILFQLNRTDEALADFDRVLALDPRNTTALSEKAQGALGAARFDAAAEAFERLVALEPDFPYAVGSLLFARLYNCDWRDFADLRSRITAGVQAGRPTMQPGHLLAVSDSAEEQMLAARLWAADIERPVAATPRPPRAPRDRIRLAYLSPDFRDHAVSHLGIELFEGHDRSRFETVGLSFGPDDKSAMRERVSRAFERFIDVRGQSDDAIARLMAEMEIDIAVDLVGYTQGARPRIFASRPATIQVNFLGYPGTLGLDCIDYIIADPTVIPDDERRFYTEQVVVLPDAYQVNQRNEAISQPTLSRADAGLPHDAFVFCCFNANYKINPIVFDVWMRLMAATDGSVLWLLEPHAAAARNLREAARQRGIAPDRIVFASRMPRPDHLARHALADLFIDTLPYNAHTTASDALRMGLPVLTCRGHAFPGRVAASLLRVLDLPELVTKTLPDYEALALRLAHDPSALSAIKTKLARNRETHPLFDSDRFRRHLEQAFTTMWERHQRGEPPAGFAVAPLS